MSADWELLRARLVDRLQAAGTLRDGTVAAAMRAVPRHAFVPQVNVEDAYRDSVIGLKIEGDIALSSMSQPTMVAIMLQQLRVEPGNRVLEIGTGSGYNAALLARIAGKSGFVTTVEIEADLASLARERLLESAVENVRVVNGDGRDGYSADAPYDRLIVTAGVARPSELPFDQLRDRGYAVVPVGGARAQYSTLYQREGELLIELGAVPCAFISLR